MSQPKLKVLIKNCFLYSFLFSCIKAIIYKNDENFETSFHLNFARLPLGWNLRYSCKYYITKRLAKLLFTNLTPKTYNWGLKQTKVLNYICAQGSSTSWFLLYNKRAKLLYNQKKTIHSNKRESQNPCHLWYTRCCPKRTCALKYNKVSCKA